MRRGRIEDEGRHQVALSQEVGQGHPALVGGHDDVGIVVALVRVAAEVKAVLHPLACHSIVEVPEPVTVDVEGPLAVALHLLDLLRDLVDQEERSASLSQHDIAPIMGDQGEGSHAGMG
eukprot:16434109-Heterocapsa_arctica.AAC.1